MKTLRTLSIVFALLAAAALLAGTVGFTESSAERPVDVATVDDDEAFIGYESPDKVVTLFGLEHDLVTVENRLGSQITDVEVTPDADGIGLGTVDLSTPDNIEVGEEETITGSFWGIGIFDLDMTLVVGASTTEAKIDGDTEQRSITVIVFNPIFKGADAKIAGPADEGASTAATASAERIPRTDSIVWYEDNGTLDSERASIATDQSVSEQLAADSDAIDVVALALPEFDKTFVDPRSEYGSGFSLQQTGPDNCYEGVARTESDLERLDSC